MSIENKGMKQVLSCRVPKNSLTIFWLGQGGFAFKTSSATIVMVDPYLSHSCKATHIHPVAINPNEVQTDYVFCTHDHRDHLDPDTVAPLAKSDPSAEFVTTPEGAAHLLKLGIEKNRVQSMQIGETRKFPTFSAKAIYAECTSGSFITHMGFVFDFKSLTVYIVGDTKVGLDGYLDKMKDVVGLRPDVMLVPINTGYSNPGPEDAARLTRLVNPRVVIPMHYDCFVENTIDPGLFLKALGETPAIKPVLMEFNGCYVYTRSRG
jgi:L-ascorbate 6-phosphate lactonase